MWVFILDLFVGPFGCGSEHTEPGAKEWIEFGPTSTRLFLGFIWDLGLLEPLGPHGSELVPEERGDEGGGMGVFVSHNGVGGMDNTFSAECLALT